MEPQDREETYLANAAGDEVTLPACPWNRKEAYLADIGDRIDGLEEEIETIKDNPDVADIVDTYADLESYDTSTLTDKDVIRVLNDETHDGNSTYYRYSKTTDSFTYIGSSKTYDVFVGTDGAEAGEKGLVPAPATTDAGKFLKADGTWDSAGSSVNVVQTTGNSATDVMSQKAVTSMVFRDPEVKTKVAIGANAVNTTADSRGSVVIGSGSVNGLGSIVIGGGNNTTAQATGSADIAIGAGALSTGVSYSIAIGSDARASSNDAIAIGKGSRATRVGEVNIGTANGSQYNGYNSSNYRLLTGVYDPQSAHDAATKGYVDGLVGDVASALNQINNGSES